MRPITPRVALAASCLLLLPLTACSDGGDKSSSGDATAAATALGPLDEYEARVMGWSPDQGTQANDKAQAEADRQNREIEELTATCMREKGFDYTPVDQSGTVLMEGDNVGADLDVEWGTREFAEKYGYGISTDPWSSPADTGQPDPNVAYTESMSESELTAYTEALWGHHDASEDELSDGEVPEWDWKQGGCQGLAVHEVLGDAPDLDSFSALEQEIQRFRDSAITDPRLAKLDASWSSCMADAGHDGLTLDTSMKALLEEWQELQGQNDPEFQALQESWDWDANPDGPPAPAVDAAAVKAFKAKEIAAAVAEFDCKSKVDYEASKQKVDHELQQAFVDQHKAELDAWVAAATTAHDE